MKCPLSLRPGAQWPGRVLFLVSAAAFCLSGVSLAQYAGAAAGSMAASPVGSQNSGTGSQNLPLGATANTETEPDAEQNITTGDQTQSSGQQQQSASPAADSGSTSLSASRILAILQQNPDAVIELKTLLSDQSQQQGTPIQPDSITDQMLYGKIASSPQFRANVTTFLRARGYITPDMFENSTDNTIEDMAGFATGLPQGSDEGSVANKSLLNPQANDYADTADSMRSSGIRSLHVEEPASSSVGLSGGAQVLKEPPPYNLLSMRDLYTQLPQQNGHLNRFGAEVFLPRENYTNISGGRIGRSIPVDISAEPEYVIGPGDTLAITLWGGVSQNITRIVDRDGKLALPEAGPVQIAGLTLERARGVITEALKRQYRNVEVAVTLSRARSIRIYVVGDVKRPGAYDISALSTSLHALVVAGGPSSVGSMRIVRHYRGSNLIGEIDLYDFLLHGVQHEDRLQSDDTLVVPPAGPQVAIYGAVKRPAIYELKGKTTLAAVLEDAGGVTVSAALGHIVIDRVQANRERETVSLDLPSGSDSETARAAIAAFAVQDGDRVHVSAILPYSQKVVYIEGHVVRPGRLPYQDGMQLSDVLHSYRDLLPEPADRGEIVRLAPPDLHPETIEFDVSDVLTGNSKVALKPFDTIRVFGRYDADAPKVTIGGEVLRPGVYPLSHGMTVAQLVRMAGGFKRDALLTDADLTSYQVIGGSKIVSERLSIPIGEVVSRTDTRADLPLKPGDVLTVHQLTGWNDIGSSITLEGEVAHPGTYGFQQGERLSSILRRAGGFRDTSYPPGAVLIREEVRKLEEKSRQELIHQLETSSASARISPTLGAGDQSAALQLIAQQQSDVLARLRSQPASGRMVIHIGSDISSWENTPADIEVRAGDILRIPKRPGFVLVSGQVYNTSAITYSPGKTASWYLRHAGGVTEIANKKEIFIIRANGSVVGHESGMWLDHNVLSTKLDPGDAVVVPQKILGASLFWRNLLTVAQISSSVAVTAAVAGIL